MIRRILIGITALACLALPCVAQPVTSGIEPGLPTTTDNIFAVLRGSIGGGDTIVDSGVTFSGTTVTAHLSIRPCQGVCIMSIRNIAVRLPSGKLAAGAYKLTTAVHSIDRRSAPPETTTSITTRNFTVYPATTSPHRLVGVYQSRHSMAGQDTGTYAFVNGDTLSVTAVLQDACCAAYTASMYSRGNAAGDTLTILVRDTAQYQCDCIGIGYVTAAVDNVTAARMWVKVLYENAPSAAPQLLYEYLVDTRGPALCINVGDVAGPGIKLFVDSSSFEYEIPTQVIKSVKVVRLAPNTAFDARTDNRLYVDNVRIDSMTAANAWSENYDTLEDFESYTGNEWHLIVHDDGSSLTHGWLLAPQGHLMEISYRNSTSGSVTNYLWESVNYPREIRAAARISVWASLKKPEGATASIRGLEPPVQRAGRELQVRSSATALVLGIPASLVPSHIELFDFSGRTVATACAPAGALTATVMLAAASRQGTYALRITRGSQSSTSRVIISR